MKPTKFHSCGIALVAVLIGSGAIWSEETESSNTETLTIEEFTIVGSRLPVKTIGISSTVLDDQAPVFRLAQVLRSMPGAAVAESGNIGSLTQMRVRGAEADHIKILLNGNTINLASQNLNLATISPIAISRVDVLNGPRSAVWGQHALAGVINLTTTARLPNNRVYMTTGSNETHNIGVDLGTELGGMPLAFYATNKSSDGTNVSYQGDERDGFDQDAFHFEYEKATDRFTANGFIRATDTISEYDPIPRDGDRHIEAEDQVIGQRAVWQQRDDLSFSVDVGLTKSTLANFSEQRNTNEWHGDLTRLAASSKYLVSENQFLDFSIEHSIEDFTQIGTVSPFGDPNYDESMATTGFAIEHAIKGGPLQWHGSLRRENNSDFAASTAWQGSVAFQQGRFTGSYSVGVGTKNPTFVERFGFTPDQFFGNENLKPETSLQHQIAIEHEHSGHSTTLLFYRSILNDEINGFAYNATHNLFSAENRTRESARHGFELRYEWESPVAALKANYAYNESTEGDEPEIRRPKHLANLSVHLPIKDKVTSRTSIRYVGEQLDLDFSTFPAPVVTLGRFYVFSTAFEFQATPLLKIHASVENLFDEEYEQVYGYRTPGRLFSIGGQVAF